MSTCASVSVLIYISWQWMTSGHAGALEMPAFFGGGTAFVLAGTDGDDDTETTGEVITFLTGTGAWKEIIEDIGRSDTVIEDWVVVIVVASSIGCQAHQGSDSNYHGLV